MVIYSEYEEMYFDRKIKINFILNYTRNQPISRLVVICLL